VDSAATGSARPSSSAAIDEADPLGLARQAVSQHEALLLALDRDEGPEPFDPDSHVPGMVNEPILQLSEPFKRFLGSGTVDARNAPARQALEAARWSLLGWIVKELGAKRRSDRRITELLAGVERGERGFVLFLRGFAARQRIHPGVTVTVSGGPSQAERWEKWRFAAELSPVPVVWVSNPVDAAMEEPGPPTRDASAGFAINCGPTWESDVRRLASAASFIVIHNPVPTDGLRAEIALVASLGRREDTFFYFPDMAADILGVDGSLLKALTPAAVDKMRSSVQGHVLAPGSLSLGGCRWVEGSRRSECEGAARAFERWLDFISAHRTAASADAELDACAALLGQVVLLEDFPRLREGLGRMAATRPF
jgi:hypothetical protein